MAVYIPSSIHDFLPSWFNVRDYGASGNGTTDDTAAFQSCINAAVSTTTRAGFQCATVFIPASAAPYLIAGTPDSNNHILTIPARDGTVSQPQFNLRFLGESPPPRTEWYPHGTLDPGVQGGVILKATYSGGTGFIIGSPTSASATTQWNGPWTGYAVDLENILFNVPSNPTIGGVDLRKALTASLKKCVFLAGTFLTASATNGSSAVQPTHSNAVAIYLPVAGNGVMIDLDSVLVCNYYTGISASECVTGRSVFITNCVNGITFAGGSHANTFSHLAMQGVLNNLQATGAVKIPLQVLALTFEQALSGWANPAVSIDDAGNLFSGSLNYFLSEDITFRKTGGTNLTCTAM